MINNTIIVARYNEDINWLNMLNNEDWISNIIVYNKGNKLENTFNDKRIKILEKKNYGREGGTYLDYIIDNYNNLPDNIWFLQGDPFEHNEYFLNFLKEENVMKYINKDYQGLTLYYKKDCNVPPYEYIKLNNNFDFNCDKNIEDHNHCKNITFLINSKHFHVVGHNFYRDLGVDEMLIYLEKNYKRKINNIADLLFNKLEFKNPKNIIPFSFSATFMTKKTSILNMCLQDYIKIKNFLLVESNNNQGGQNGYVLERLWRYIFTKESYENINEYYNEILKDKLVYSYNFKDRIIDSLDLRFSKICVKEDENSILFYMDKNNQYRILPKLNFSMKIKPKMVNDTNQNKILKKLKLI